MTIPDPRSENSDLSSDHDLSKSAKPAEPAEPAEPSVRVTQPSPLAEVMAVAFPLMVSTGMFSLVLFVDRTLLLWHDPTSMGASLAAGTLFWLTTCPMAGVMSMTGAIVSQYVGAGQPRRVGGLLWQSVWLSLATIPLFAIAAWYAETWFEITGQPERLRVMESAYYRVLMIGGTGEVLQTALSGFFAGTQRTRTIMVVSLASGVLNLLLDVVLIFGVPVGEERWFEFGIVGAAAASSISFWFKAVVYAALLWRPRWRIRYGFGAWRVHARMMRRLVYFGIPAGLMHLTESGGFTAIVLEIGQLGDIPLQATSMALNFNMIAFIPLVGLSVAASVLVGQHLIADGPASASRRVATAMGIGWAYSLFWVVAYVAFADSLIGFYSWSPTSADSDAAGLIARQLLGFVAIYLVLDATQLILAGSLRGAGDTWFVLLAGAVVSVGAYGIGVIGEPDGSDPLAGLRWWWWVITGWVAGLAVAMTFRYLGGKWKSMRMV